MVCTGNGLKHAKAPVQNPTSAAAPQTNESVKGVPFSERFWTLRQQRRNLQSLNGTLPVALGSEGSNRSNPENLPTLTSRNVNSAHTDFGSSVLFSTGAYAVSPLCFAQLSVCVCVCVCTCPSGQGRYWRRPVEVSVKGWPFSPNLVINVNSLSRPV